MENEITSIDQQKNCQCTRCRHKHVFGARKWVPSKKFSGMKDSVCPKCNCKNYYELKSP